MNSMKLFSKNYAIQNLKKSKGILAIMLLIIPIITLFILYNYDNTSYATPCEMSTLIIANLVGMFIIPFIVSNVLLGYVYKRNSIDFINSMPITRKKIYLTNIITGMLYLILLQIINFIIIATYVVIAKSMYISIPMVVDSFIVMTIAYCFMFALSSLALTVSGNRFIQIVIAMLILFLIPFIRIINLESVFSSRVNVIDYDGTENIFRTTETKIFSLPINICYSLAIEKSIYDVGAIIYTLVLGVIYIFIGIKLFEKRKMEETGNSFASTKVHLFVKALTLYPMVTLVKYIFNISKLPEIILAIFLIFVYYFIYDLITNKKIKLKTTIISFICFFLILLGIIYGIEFINKKFIQNTKEIDISDVKEISIALEPLSYGYYYDKEYILIKNDEIKKLILENITDLNTKTQTGIEAELRLKNNKVVKIDFYMEDDAYTELLEKIYNDEDYIKTITEKYILPNEAIMKFSNRESNINLRDEKEIRDLINENIEKAIKYSIKYTIDWRQNGKNPVNSGNYYSRNFLSLYFYKNHKSEYCRIELDNLVELEKVVVKKVNEKTKDAILKKSKLVDENYNLNFSITKNLESGKSKQTNLMLYKDEYGDVINFFINNYNNEFDPQKDYYEIRCYDLDLVFYTNYIQEFDESAKNKIDFEYEDDRIFIDDNIDEEFTKSNF